MTVRLSLNTHPTDCRREDPFARALNADSPPIKTDHSIKSFGQGDRGIEYEVKASVGEFEARAVLASKHGAQG